MNNTKKAFGKMKKILVFAPTAPSTGITQYILNILNELKSADACIDILSFRNDRLKKWAEENGTEYFEMDISMYKHPILYRRFLKKVFSKGYDTVHFNLSSISTLTIFKYANLGGAKKIIMHSHSSFTDLASQIRRIVFSNLHKFLRIFANKYFDVKCACSAPAAEWMYGKREAKNALILNNAVDTEKFAYTRENANEIREKYGVKTKYLIGHIGRFTVQKNHSFIIDTFNALCKIRNDCTLMLVGNGEFLESIKNKVKELNLSENVIFVDFQEDIYKYYSAMDLFLMPSLFEGLPITLVEAQANGLSALVSDAVTKECDLTGLTEFYPLDLGCERWAEKISEMLQVSGRDKKDVSKKLDESGFSLSCQAQVISELYFE